MKKTTKKILLMFVVITSIAATTASLGIVYGESIATVISAIMQKATILFESVGQNKTAASGNAMENVASETKTSINDIFSNAQNDLANELDHYKNSQLAQKEQELKSLLADIKASVSRKKAEKLDEYKLKIDEQINKEYDKLLNDLKLD